MIRDSDRTSLVLQLYELGAVQFGDFTHGVWVTVANLY